MNEQPPRVQFDLSKNSEINKIIAEGIKAAEALEDSIAKPKGNQTNNAVNQHNYKEHKLTNPQGSSYSTPPFTDTHSSKHNKSTSHLSVSEYLQPPSASSKPLFRRVQVPPRPSGNFNRNPSLKIPYKQFIVPQPSIIVSHFKKPVSPLVRPFVKQSKPIKAIASVLVLGDQFKAQNKFEQELNKRPEHIERVKAPYIPIGKHQPSKSHQREIIKSIPFREGPTNKYQPSLLTTNERNHRPNGSAHKNGFQPDSVIVENGFRPIIKRRIDDNAAADNNNRRQDDNVADTNEGDALFVLQESENKQFEPMFVPSPPDNRNANSEKLLMNENLMGRMDVEDGDDKMAMAGERVDAYYLPPDNPKVAGPIYPQGTLVTYDGRTVLDYSLVAPLAQPLSNNQNILFGTEHTSRTEQLIRNTPQFGPFHGEIPPLTQHFVPPEVPPNVRSTIQLPVTEYANPITTNRNPISTKLKLIQPTVTKQLDDSPLSKID